MAARTTPQPAHQAPFQEEGLRVAGAFVALLAVLLALSGGLLWRERVRMRALEAARPPAAAHAAAR